jgi:hypothetical protein
VASESIVSGKAVAALTWVWFDPTVDLGMALEIMLADETFLAMRALELSISKVRLDV